MEFAAQMACILDPAQFFFQAIVLAHESAEGSGRGIVTHGPLDLIEHDLLCTFSMFGSRSSHAVRVVVFFCGA